MRRRWNGETEYADGVLRAEAALGFDVTVVTPGECAFAEAAARHARVVEFPRRRWPGSEALWLQGLLGCERFHLVHSLRETAHLQTALALRGRAPLVHLRSGTKEPGASALDRWLYRKMTAAVIVSSTAVRDRLVKRTGMDPRRVHRILAPVDCRRFRPLPPDEDLKRELGIPPGAPVVLCVARLAPVKGHDCLVEAMGLVRRRFPEAVLVLVGCPWEGQPGRLQAQARRLGFGQSLFCLGPRNDINRFLSIATVCAQASIGSEENSRAIEEYLAAGRPAVGTTVGVIPELLEPGVTGFLVPPHRPQEMAAAIGRVLADPDLARRMGEAARRFAVERLSSEVFAAALGEALRPVVPEWR
ncbi:MAG TPA: glycosyltransferase family 4 protein [bacterium]|nr:glycosyltransferase family 4 protein [bacterium]